MVWSMMGYGKYSMVEGQNIKIYGEIGFAVHTYDLLNGYPNKCGISRAYANPKESNRI